MKLKTAILIIRIILTIVVLIGVYRETGKWTAITLGWIAIMLEKWAHEIEELHSFWEWYKTVATPVIKARQVGRHFLAE